MTVDAPVDLTAALTRLKPDSLSLIPWEKETERTIARACSGYAGRVFNIFIGPEGGWEGQEVAQAEQAGICPVRLGPTLLRSETAGITAATLVLREAGVY
jgi:16S rRNA (uracil1498-N3)-methyltransferase